MHVTVYLTNVGLVPTMKQKSSVSSIEEDNESEAKFEVQT